MSIGRRLFAATPPRRRAAWRAAWLEARRKLSAVPGADRDLAAIRYAERAANDRHCRDCGASTGGLGTCGDCDLYRERAGKSCRACCTWMLPEVYAGPIAGQHLPGCPLRDVRDWWPRDEDEAAAVRAAQATGVDRMDLWRRAEAVLARLEVASPPDPTPTQPDPPERSSC